MNQDEAEAERQRAMDRQVEAPEDRLQRERIGVAGDPTPDHEYRDEPPQHEPDGGESGVSPSVRAAAKNLEATGILTEKQALAYVLRDVEGVRREEAADRMGTSTSNLDTHLSKARGYVEDARELVERLEALESDE